MSNQSTRAFSILVELDPALDTYWRTQRTGGRPTDREVELLRTVLAAPRQDERAAVVSLPDPVLPVGAGHRLRWVAAALVLSLLVLGGGLWGWSAHGASPVAHATHGAPIVPAPRQPSPSWRLVSELSPAEFQQGSGNPTSVVGVTCTGGTRCFLSTGYGLDYTGGGALFGSTDGGHSWSPMALPSPSDAVTTAVSCAGATWCAAGGGVLDPTAGDPAAGKPSRDPVLLVTQDGGGTWTSVPIPLPATVEQLPAVNQLPAETTTWPGMVDAVSCSAPGVCSVLGHAQVFGPGNELLFAETTDAGLTWTTGTLPELPSEATDGVPMQPGNVETMACPTARRCIVTASLTSPSFTKVVDVWRTTDGGTTWTESRLAGIGRIDPNLSCPTPTDCWAGPANLSSDGSSVLLHTTDGAATWSQIDAGRNLPHPVSSPNVLGYGEQGLSCASASTCFVTAPWGMDETSDAGGSWHQVPLPSTVSGASGISCEHGGFCVAIAYPSPPGVPDPFDGGSLVITDAPPG